MSIFTAKGLIDDGVRNAGLSNGFPSQSIFVACVFGRTFTAPLSPQKFLPVRSASSTNTGWATTRVKSSSHVIIALGLEARVAECHPCLNTSASPSAHSILQDMIAQPPQCLVFVFFRFAEAPNSLRGAALRARACVAGVRGLEKDPGSQGKRTRRTRTPKGRVSFGFLMQMMETPSKI